MKTKTSLLILLLACGQAHAAQWSKVGSSGDATIYIDKGSAIKVDAAHKVWTLHSHASPRFSPDGSKYHSLKALHLYSCKERTTTLQGEVYYAGAMGAGEAVQNLKYEKFAAQDIVPDSPAENALKAICRGKK